MSALRAALAALVVVVALVLQVSVLSHVAWEGVVPNLVLLVVVGVGLTRGAEAAMVLGFLAGALVDLAPPADHVAGRWALALLVVGYVAGRVRREARPTATTVLATVAASSFVGTSIFALSGLLLRDPASSVPDLLTVIGIGVLCDLLLTPFVLPPVMAASRRLQPHRTALR